MRHSIIHVSWGAIVGGLFMLLFGGILWAFQPLLGWIGGTVGTALLKAVHPEFFDWLRMLGGVVLIQGAYRVVTFFLRPPTVLGRLVRLGDALLGALGIPLLLWLRERVEIIPIVLVSDGGQWVTSPQENLFGILRWALLFVVIVIVIGIVVAVVRVFIPSAEERRAASAR